MEFAASTIISGKRHEPSVGYTPRKRRWVSWPYAICTVRSQPAIFRFLRYCSGNQSSALFTQDATASDFTILQAVFAENKSRRIHSKSVLRPRTAPNG